jgi:hypothetical protein
MRWQFIAVLFLLFLAFVPSYAQQQLKGKVKDVKGNPIASANVNLRDKDGNILVFTKTNEKGNYSLLFAEENKNLRIEVTVIGYTKLVVPVSDLNKSYDIIMTDTEIKLQTVVVKNRPVLVVKGDTLHYKTSDFADKQDRSIGDVLRKMPGMEVSENGKVSYNGKSISNLYIDGDNMLDDKYSIGTKSIPHGAVEKVEVIENDQPIKMLRKNNASEDVALNLVIKDEAKLKVMGEIKAGVGAPKRFDGNANAMLFKKRVKFINNIKGNNIGIDPGIELTSFNLSDYLKKLDNNTPANLLSAGAAGVPILPQSRSVFNKAGLINLNNFYKFNQDLQLKANISYLYDKRIQAYSKFSETYLPDQTIQYNEFQQNVFNPQQLEVKINVNANAEKYYFNNVMMAAYLPFSTYSTVEMNGVGANQRLRQETLDLSNELSYRKKFKSEHTINFYSFINRTSKPEVLDIRPGLNEMVLNNGNPYDGLSQFVKVPTWFTNNFISFAIANGKFVQTYKGGFNVQHQALNSELYRIQTDKSTELVSAEMTNDLEWNKNKLYTEATYEYNNEKLKMGLVLPLSYNQISYHDPSKGLDKSLDRLFLNPSFNIKYQTGTENYVTANYSYKNDLGRIDDIYRGTILRNYRSLFTNDAPIAEQQTHSGVAGFNFRKAMQMFFFNLYASYSTSRLNTISSYTLSNNIQRRVVLALANDVTNLDLNANASKYLFNLKSTISAGISYSSGTFDQLQNNLLLPFRSETISYKTGIDARLTHFINLSYSANYAESKNKTSFNDLITIFHQLRQQSTLTLTTFKSLFATFSAEHIFTRQSSQPNLNYLFADVNLRYRFIKIKTDLEFGITNLANIKKFEAVSISANAFTSGTYEIPGRVAMLRATFNF